MKGPTLLKHICLDRGNASVWNEVYRSEYEGLQSVDTWEVITEEEFKSIKHLSQGTMLPAMTIAMIKYDGEGKPD
jgi:hypothetical protein